MSSGGEEVGLDGPSAYVGTANALRSRAWTYELGYRSVSGVSRDAREAEVDVTFLDRSRADLLRRLADRDMSAGRPGRIWVGEWSQRAYVAASDVSSVNPDGSLSAALTVLLLDGAWGREVVTQVRPRAVASGDWLDYPHGYPYDYGGTAANQSVEVAGLMEAPVRIVVYGPAREVSITATCGGVSNLYRVSAEVPGGSYLDIDGTGFPKSIRLVGEYGDVSDRFAAGERGQGEGSGRYCFQPLPPGRSSLAWDGSFGFDIHHIEQEGEPPWTS